MALVDKLFDNVESFFAWSGLLLKQSHTAYCDLETADSKHVLVTKNASLISVIRIDGFRRFIGKAEFKHLCEQFCEAVQSSFSSTGHFLQFYFSYDPDGVAYHIDQALQPGQETASRINLNIDDIFLSKQKVLGDVCSHEDCFLIIWTEPSALQAKYIKHAFKVQHEKIQSYNLPMAKEAANLFLGLPELRNLHDSLITTVVEDLQQIGFYIKLLDVHSTLYETRKSVDPTFTSPEWTPSLPGDTIPIRLEENDSAHNNSYDISNIMWPPLSSQVIPREGENIDFKNSTHWRYVICPLIC
ncbi:hypothetical protein [Piscirickettsia litoralis]|uniref:hypothetical protein n=1 Tax=Piscirickettsia litoralis TaxID=1891921 RepID=UPI001F170A2B|nr:hypothetical protein [Piscirickettsia litoralis]